MSKQSSEPTPGATGSLTARAVWPIATGGQAPSGTLASESTPTIAISIAFWLCLVSAAALYASVALSPKLLTFLTLRHQFYNGQVKLVALEQQVRYLRKVGHALEHEPEFAAELARIDFDASRPGDVRIPVDQHLSLETRPEPPLVLSDGTLPWYTPLVERFAVHRPFRTATLAAAALITLLAFTFLHASQSRQLRTATATLQTGLRRLVNRYRKPPVDAGSI